MPEIVKLERTLEEQKAAEYYNLFFEIATKLEEGWRLMGNKGSGVGKFLEALALMIGYHWMEEDTRK